GQLRGARVGGEHGGAEALGMARDDVQRRGADRAGGAEHGDLALHGAAHSPSRLRPSANTGSAASRLSMRSSTPPWPGISALESLAPAWRLSRLSNRSPTMDATAATSASRASCARPDQATPSSGATATASSTA